MHWKVTDQVNASFPLPPTVGYSGRILPVKVWLLHVSTNGMLVSGVAEASQSASIKSEVPEVQSCIASMAKVTLLSTTLKALVPRFADADIYICGPGPLVEAVKAAADDLGVPKNRFHDEAFAFHSE